MQDRSDANRRDAGQEGCGQEGCRKGGNQDRWETGHVGSRTVGMQDRRDA